MSREIFTCSLSKNQLILLVYRSAILYKIFIKIFITHTGKSVQFIPCLTGVFLYLMIYICIIMHVFKLKCYGKIPIKSRCLSFTDNTFALPSSKGAHFSSNINTLKCNKNATFCKYYVRLYNPWLPLNQNNPFILLNLLLYFGPDIIHKLSGWIVFPYRTFKHLYQWIL